MTKKTFKLYDVGVWLSRGVSKGGGGAGEAIAPSLFGRIEGATGGAAAPHYYLYYYLPPHPHTLKSYWHPCIWLFSFKYTKEGPKRNLHFAHTSYGASSLCSKYVKNCNIFGQILNIWVKLILKKKFQIFFSMFSFA